MRNCKQAVIDRSGLSLRVTVTICPMHGKCGAVCVFRSGDWSTLTWSAKVRAHRVALN